MLILFGIMVIVGLGLLANGLNKFSMNLESYDGYNDEAYDNQQEEQLRLLNEEMTRQQEQQFMEESLKSVTPFEMGGYDMDQGNSFNDFNNGMF